MFTPSYLIYAVVTLAFVVVSSSFHEFSHALAAHFMGDDTAKEQGRLSLNPMRHIDLFGSVILPFITLVLGNSFIAYANPVPYNPSRLKNRRVGEAVVALAGPLANLLLAGIGACIFRASYPFLIFGVGSWVLTFYQGLFLFVNVNLCLCFFNLIPFPPLDGSKIIAFFLPDEMRVKYYRLQQCALPILLILLWIVPRLLNIDIMSWYFNHTAWPLFQWMLGG